jgi:hypothetical protein
MKRRYEPNSKSHVALEAMADGRVQTHIGLAQVLGIGGRPGPRRKLSYILLVLVEDGLLARIGKTYAITTAGLAALDRLRSGETIEILGVAA